MPTLERGSAALLVLAQLAAAAAAIVVGSVVLADRAHASQLEQSTVSVTRHVDACASDEGVEGQASRPCVWDAQHLGNGLGQSFIVRRDGRISRISHARAHALIWGAR